MVVWREARTNDSAARALLTEYFAHRSVSFPADQGRYRVVFPEPEQFVPPTGVFLIVGDVEDVEDADVGCGGIRRIGLAPSGAVRFEVKHLFVQPRARGRGLGRALLDALEARARILGAEELVLDTNASLAAAGSLYAASGFVPIDRYNDNPNATHWYGKTL